MTSEERRFYTRGVLAACMEFKVCPDVVTTVCGELGLTPEDVAKFCAEERDAAHAGREVKKPTEPADLGGAGLREVKS